MRTVTDEWILGCPAVRPRIGFRLGDRRGLRQGSGIACRRKGPIPRAGAGVRVSSGRRGGSRELDRRRGHCHPWPGDERPVPAAVRLDGCPPGGRSLRSALSAGTQSAAQAAGQDACSGGQKEERAGTLSREGLHFVQEGARIPVFQPGRHGRRPLGGLPHQIRCDAGLFRSGGHGMQFLRDGSKACRDFLLLPSGLVREVQPGLLQQIPCA